MTGATITDVGTPAADSCRNASSRRAGVAARGSITRASLGSSVVTDSATLARLRFAMRDRMSRSRSTSADLVTMPTGWPECSSTSRIRRMIWYLLSIGWYGSVLVPIAIVRGEYFGADSSRSSSFAASGFMNSFDSKSSPGDSPR